MHSPTGAQAYAGGTAVLEACGANAAPLADMAETCGGSKAIYDACWARHACAIWRSFIAGLFLASSSGNTIS